MSNVDPNPSGDILWYYISQEDYAKLAAIGFGPDHQDPDNELTYNPVDESDFYARSELFDGMIFAPKGNIDPQEEAFLNMNGITLNSWAFRRSNQPVAILRP